MPNPIWVIFDNNTGLYCDHYSINLNFCSWSNPATAQTFATLAQAESAINEWEGGSQNGRFIGKNPPPR